MTGISSTLDESCLFAGIDLLLFGVCEADAKNHKVCKVVNKISKTKYLAWCTQNL